MEEMVPYEAGNNGRNKKFIAIAVVILLIICGIGGYLYYKRTPAYSLQLIQESVKEHNWEKFSHHVDTKNLADAAFDDIIEITMEERGDMDAQTKALASSFIKLIKPNLTSLLESAVKEYVETGEFKKDETANNNSTSPNKKAAQKKGNPADNLLQDTKADKLKFSGIKSTETSDNTAIVTLELRDEAVNANYDLKIRMIQLEDGTWKISKIDNLKDFYKAVKENEQQHKKAA